MVFRWFLKPLVLLVRLKARARHLDAANERDLGALLAATT
jgi:hypothetical protein